LSITFASGAPGQRCGPKPKPTWGFGERSRTKSSGSANGRHPQQFGELFRGDRLGRVGAVDRAIGARPEFGTQRWPELVDGDQSDEHAVDGRQRVECEHVLDERPYRLVQ
jgi:hypothetical protein